MMIQKCFTGGRVRPNANWIPTTKYTDRMTCFPNGRIRKMIHQGFSTNNNNSTITLPNDTIIRVIGKKYTDTRQYLLLPSNLTTPSLGHTTSTDEERKKSLNSFYTEVNIASLYANRNILFGAKIGPRYQQDYNKDSSSFVEATLPLVKAALHDASMEGEQPQALSTVYGLSAWVRSCLETDAANGNPSYTIQTLQKNIEEDTDAEASRVAMEAITAIATGIPRPGHSVVGIGTYRDGKETWEALAKEYASIPNTSSFETALYKQAGGDILHIEYLADKSAPYMKEAGGAMVRYLFW